jgi:hypothetical protein
LEVQQNQNQEEYENRSKRKILSKVWTENVWNERCSSHKCGLYQEEDKDRECMEDKPRALSLYGRQLLEKQRLKFSYLLNEN